MHDWPLVHWDDGFRGRQFPAQDAVRPDGVRHSSMMTPASLTRLQPEDRLDVTGLSRRCRRVIVPASPPRRAMSGN